jgi:protein phosphatase
MFGRLHTPPHASTGARLIASGLTDVGRKREHNEDAFALLPDLGLFVVADGMGGHACGEVASAMVIDALREFFHRSSDDDATWPYRYDTRLSHAANRLSCGIRLANARIFADSSANVARRGMGTTVVAAAVTPGQIHIAHVGDSRAYRLRGERLEKLTRDHSLLEDWKRALPGMTEEEERAFPHRNVISRAVGMREDVEVDVQDQEVLPGDCYLLCTDGLTGMVEDAAIARIATRRPLDDALAELIARANEAGGVDNITAILIERPT